MLFCCLFLVITFQYVAKTVRQSTFIDALGATNLPWVYLLVALCSYPLLRVYVRLADRMPRHRLIAATCSAVLLSMVGFWWLYQFSWRWVPVAFYIWVSIAFVTTVSQFWSFANHVYDARQAKRLFGLIGAGGLLGGIAGGQVARLTTQWIGTRYALLVAAVLLLGVVALIRAVHRVHPESDERGLGATGMGEIETATGGFDALRRSRHLQLIAVIMVLGTVVGQVVDLQFNWAVELTTNDLGQRTAYFGNFFSVVGIAAFLFQVLFTARIHRTLGVGAAMRVLPVTLGLGTIVLLASSGMAVETLVLVALSLKVGEGGIRFSLDQSTRELLFLPVPSALRIKAKAFVDVFVQRSAKGLAALLLLPVTFGWVGPIQAGWLTLALCAAWLALVGTAYRTYVKSFRTGLKQRTMDATVAVNLDDVKTVELLVQSLGSADARQVLHSLDLLDANGRGNLVPPLLLYHDDAAVRRRTLQVLAGEGRRDAAPLIERRLSDDDPEVRAEAIRVLTEFHAGDACALMLPRLHEPDPKVRAAAVACLMNHGDEETIRLARRTLQHMLHDESPDYRAEAIRAIGAIRGSEFDGELLQSLYDRDPRVAREAIQATRRIVAREGFSPLYAPRLVSLLQNRRLKHDAREALVAFGEEAVAILVHFMNDSEESIWVRRALPKTLARIGGPKVVAALIDSLAETEDLTLRSQLVESLAALRDEVASSGARPRVERAIEAESRRYLRRLADLRALGSSEQLRFRGPLPEWDPRELNLLTQMVAERLEEHLRNLFGLLALIFPATDVWAAHRSLTNTRPALRAHALEYLDNTLSGDLRRHVFAAIDDAPLEDKLQRAEKLFGIEVDSRTAAVGGFLDGAAGGGTDAVALTVAGLYTVYTDGMRDLYPRITGLVSESLDPLVPETARWVAGRLKLPLPAVGDAG